MYLSKQLEQLFKVEVGIVPPFWLGSTSMKFACPRTFVGAESNSRAELGPKHSSQWPPKSAIQRSLVVGSIAIEYGTWQMHLRRSWEPPRPALPDSFFFGKSFKLAKSLQTLPPFIFPCQKAPWTFRPIPKKEVKLYQEKNEWTSDAHGVIMGLKPIRSDV